MSRIEPRYGLFHCDTEEEWREQRCFSIGASEAGAILGYRRWPAPVRTQQRILAGPEGLEADAPTDQMRWGKAAELAFEAFLNDAGERGTFTRFDRVIARPKRNLEFLHASPDGVWTTSDTSKALVELKTDRHAAGWGDPETDQVPESYWIQCQMALGLLKACDVDWDPTECHLWVSILGAAPVRYVIKHDAVAFDGAAHLLAEWWDRHIVSRRPVAPDGSSDYSEWLKVAFPTQHTGLSEQLAEAGKDFDRLADRYTQLTADISVLEKDALRIKQEMQLLIGNLPGVRGAWGKATWKRNRDSTTIQWEEAFRAMALGLDISDEQCRTFVEPNTHTKPGARVFRFTPATERSEQ